MRGLLLVPAFAATFGTIVLAQSPNTPSQIQPTSPGILAPGMQLPQKPMLPNAASPGGVLGNQTNSPAGSFAPPANTTIGVPPHNVPRATDKIESRSGIKLSPSGGGPKSEDDQKAAAEKLKSLVPAIPRPQLSGRTGGAQKIPAGAKGGPPSGSPKSDGDQQDAADKLKSLVPGIAGPRRPPGEPKQEAEKQAAGKQWEAKASKSIGVIGNPLGVGLGPKSTPPTTGIGVPPVPVQSETKKDSPPGLDSGSSGMAVEKVEIATEKVEKP